ncbi:MAG: metal ABC transporter solute-binding protein, Zn/Mn family [Thermomicrobiales bacterium]
MARRQRSAVVIALLAIVLIVGVSLGQMLFAPVKADDGGRIKVTTTVGMIADMVRNVGGDRVEVTGLMGPGVDPHLYKPSAHDVGRLSDADIIFYGGLHLEGRMGETFEAIGRTGKPTIAVSEHISEDLLRTPPEFKGQHDPHIWFDVTLWMLALDTVSERLQEYSPDDAELFQMNAARYRGELEALDAYVREQVARLPEERRVLVTAHDAFGYFGDAYGFEVRGLQGISTASETGAGDVQDLIGFIVERKLPAIFVESSVSKATIDAVQEGSKARGWEVVIGGELFSDAMGEDGTPEGTYIGMVRHNIDTIVGALIG